MGDLDQDVGESNNRSDSKKSGDKKPSFGSGWRWVILLAGWLSFALFSATLYTSGRQFYEVTVFFPVFSSINELNEIAGLFFVIYLEEFGETRSKTAWVF